MDSLIGVDQLSLNFDGGRLLLLNGAIGLVMFGVALDMRVDDFRRVLVDKRPIFLGLGCQFVLLPAFTWMLVLLIEPPPSMALGMMLVASCPGGTLSNFLTHLANGNTALSVSLSAVSTLAATVMTPFNLAFWAGLYPPTARILRQVALDPMQLVGTVALILGLPIVLGMTVAARRPELADRLRRPMKIFSLLVFAGVVLGAIVANFEHFQRWIGAVAGLVLVHNATALGIGYGSAWLSGLRERDRRAVCIEVGIQNSALGLVLIFDYFGGLGGMALVAAWWGIWHILAGLSLGWWWSKRATS